MTCPSMETPDDWETNFHMSRAYGVARDKGGSIRDGYIIDGDKNMYVETASVTSPSEFHFYADSAFEDSGELAQPIVYFWHNLSDDQNIHTRHDEKANVWFIDGHVQGHSPSSLGQLGIFGGWTENKFQVAF